MFTRSAFHLYHFLWTGAAWLSDWVLEPQYLDLCRLAHQDGADRFGFDVSRLGIKCDQQGSPSAWLALQVWTSFLQYLVSSGSRQFTWARICGLSSQQFWVEVEVAASSAH